VTYSSFTVISELYRTIWVTSTQRIDSKIRITSQHIHTNRKKQQIAKKIITRIQTFVGDILGFLRLITRHIKSGDTSCKHVLHLVLHERLERRNDNLIVSRVSFESLAVAHFCSCMHLVTQLNLLIKCTRLLHVMEVMHRKRAETPKRIKIKDSTVNPDVLHPADAGMVEGSYRVQGRNGKVENGKGVGRHKYAFPYKCSIIQQFQDKPDSRDSFHPQLATSKDTPSKC
jgi:hypothetical protein